MGGAYSRTQFQRSKSVSTFGRSSQRGLFQKSKAKLKQIDKKLQAGGVDVEEIRKEFEGIERELNSVSAAVKEKNKHKYDEVLKLLQETREKFESKHAPKDNDTQETDKLAKSSLGRSSQKGLFQESKAKLKEIDKLMQKCEEIDPASQEEILKQIEDIDKALNAISAALKDKNKQQYQEITKHLQETRGNFESNLHEEPVTPKTVELKLVKVVANTEGLDEEVEMRRPIQEETAPPGSPKVKFGIQVMPSSPRISQDLLKRKTLPINEGPKAEFERLRVVSDTTAFSSKSAAWKQNELYNLSLPPKLGQDIPVTPPSTPNSDREDQRESMAPRKPPRLLKEASVEETALEQIECIGSDIDHLEEKLRFFNGSKEDKTYIELHEKFVRSLISLDNIETNGDPIVKQEKKISVQRIQELMSILERLVEQNEEMLGNKDDNEEDAVFSAVGERGESGANRESKPISATAL